MKKKWMALGLCLVMVVSLCACTPDQPDQPSTKPTVSAAETDPATSEPNTEAPTEPTTESTTQALALTISCAESKRKIIGENTTGTMHASFNKEGYAQSDVKWQSSAPAVMEIDENGNYVCKGLGKTTITATITSGDETASESVVFDVQRLATSADFNATAIEVKAGYAAPIGAQALPLDATDLSIYWENSDKSIAAIQGTNVVGYRIGSCVLTAYNNRGDSLGTVTITVLPGPIYGADEHYGNQIVEYTTYFDSKKTNRTQNLRVAAQSIMANQGGILGAGQSFSFNGWVGERTKDKGYLYAGVFNGSKEEQGLAGGICQVSTTLFNAALLANFEIEQRHPHSMDPLYSKPGQDAAIQWPNLDLRFKNTLDVPVKIVYQIQGNTMTVRLFTPGEASYPLPKIWIEQGGGGLNYWMKRYVNGEVNYSCTTRYVAYHP